MTGGWLDRLSRLGRVEIRLYSERTPAEKLYRHHRLARTFGWLWLASGGVMMSTLVEFMFSKPGLMRTVSLIILLTSTAVFLVAALPGIVSYLWIQDVEHTLTQRGLQVPGEGKALEKKVPGYTMKMVFWFAVLLVCGSLARHGFLPLPFRRRWE